MYFRRLLVIAVSVLSVVASPLFGEASRLQESGPWVRGDIKIWGDTIKIGGVGGTMSEWYKFGGAPKVKIKDFTLASKNLGGGARAPPCPTHLPPTGEP